MFKIFCYVVEEKNFSSAAKRAFISQPAVTKKIRQLEEHYSTVLFKRDHTPLLLTQAGEMLYYHAKLIMNEYEESVESLENIRMENEQILKVGSSFTLGEYVLPEIMSEIRTVYPHLQVQLSISNTPSILQSLSEREIDLAFVEGDIKNEVLTKNIISTDTIIAVVSPNHKWAKQRNIVPRQLLEERFIRREHSSATRMIIESHLAERISLNELQDTLELSTTQAIKSAVQSGLGYGFVSRLAVQQELKAGILVEVDISGVHIERPLWVATRNQRYPKESINVFSTFTQEYLKRKMGHSRV